jgi:hypothetical protein
MLAEVLYIGDRLRDLRKRRLLTQEQLAERSGVGIATIVRVERSNLQRHPLALPYRSNRSRSSPVSPVVGAVFLHFVPFFAREYTG